MRVRNGDRQSFLWRDQRGAALPAWPDAGVASWFALFPLWLQCVGKCKLARSAFHKVSKAVIISGSGGGGWLLQCAEITAFTSACSHGPTASS